MPSDPGLRERKKLATRQALCEAALRLALERGYENVTVDDIAAAAGLSPRTFFNYFPTKVAAFVGDDLERGHAFVATIVAAPEEAPLWKLLRQTAISTLALSELAAEQRALKEQLARIDSDFLAEALATFGQLEQDLAEELARRLRGAPPLRARLMANAVSAAVRAATETWMESGSSSPDSYAVLLGEAFESYGPAFVE